MTVIAPTSPPEPPVPRAPVNTTTLAVMVGLHLGALVGIVLLFTSRVAPATIVLALAMWAVTGMSITAGYHRLFAHRTYRASAPLRWAFLLGGAAAFQNSAVAWSADHRDHHADPEGPNDPYSIELGFWWAHMGWMFRSRAGSAAPLERLKDLARYPSVVLQHRWYALVAVTTGLLLPLGLGALWGDALGAFFVAGALRAVVVLQATCCINSVAHYWGRPSYDRASTARDNSLTALITFGEGYHSFHHRFQADYRNGVRWWQVDPGKWLIWSLERVRMARSVRRTSRAAIAAARADA